MFNSCIYTTSPPSKALSQNELDTPTAAPHWIDPFSPDRNLETCTKEEKLLEMLNSQLPPKQRLQWIKFPNPTDLLWRKGTSRNTPIELRNNLFEPLKKRVGDFYSKSSQKFKPNKGSCLIHSTKNSTNKHAFPLFSSACLRSPNSSKNREIVSVVWKIVSNKSLLTIIRAPRAKVSTDRIWRGGD